MLHLLTQGLNILSQTFTERPYSRAKRKLWDKACDDPELRRRLLRYSYGRAHRRMNRLAQRQSNVFSLLTGQPL